MWASNLATYQNETMNFDKNFPHYIQKKKSNSYQNVAYIKEISKYL